MTLPPKAARFALDPEFPQVTGIARRPHFDTSSAPLPGYLPLPHEDHRRFD
jgi:hypothetical protein